jgi:signal transduction histidine kinase
MLARAEDDVTERSSMNEPHSAPNRDLEALKEEVERLREGQRQTELLIRELGDAVAARDAFIAVAGHELRNPMGAIVVSVSHLLAVVRRGKDPLPDWLLPRVEQLERLTRTFVRRATTLLDVSRITSGQLRPEQQHVDLSAVVREVMDGFASEVARAKCDVAVSIADDVSGWWDPTGIEQVVYNVVSNAIKYGAGKPIAVSLTADGAIATLRVEDRGIGIADADRDRIFRPFERAVTQRTHSGFGLGLWITQQIVAAHGGRITVESRDGGGTVFTVNLPQTIYERQP